MSEEFFVYHFNGGNGLAGAFSELGESGDAGVSTEYGYLVNEEEIPALEDHLVHVAELEGGINPARDFSSDAYKTLRESPEEVVPGVRTEFDIGRVNDYDIRNILRTPVEGHAPGQELSLGPEGGKELRKSARKGYLEGTRERFRNNRAKDNTANQVDFYTNSFEEAELDELETFIESL